MEGMKGGLEGGLEGGQKERKGAKKGKQIVVVVSNCSGVKGRSQGSGGFFLPSPSIGCGVKEVGSPSYYY
jgi:hypothetical protein